ncbi:TadE family type IV pilus minor pilin [Actinokineospora enzanensis]|uniref:TadE family type IV pilus minor pilin n=1 Tax=Actinokineospora enzanensis TaxID=155975 RepID=UPI00036E4147|nr:TadE family type IV pilus minor pilin [Actinokineospora enzanensis]
MSGERGSVTVEAAVALGALVVVLGLVLAGVRAVTDRIRCVDAAREAARLVARGEPDQARRAAAAIAPAGADVTVHIDGDRISVSVSVIGTVLPVRIDGDAYAVAEPGGMP